MARLLQGALSLLLLTVSANGSGPDAHIFDSFQKITSVEGLLNYNGNMTIAFLEEMLVTKTCFRDWIDDEECEMHKYDTAKKVDKEAAKKAHSKGYQDEQRIVQQLASINKNAAAMDASFKNKTTTTNGVDYIHEVSKQIQKNLKQMVDKVSEEKAENIDEHLGSKEFSEMFNNISKALTDSGFEVSNQGMHHEVARLMYSIWVEEEKEKSTMGSFSHASKSHDDWIAMMNKMPDTLKYTTTGATPIIKHHLAKALKKLDEEQYKKLKETSQSYLQKLANKMRHEAMAKANTIIAQVMHSMKNGEIDHSNMTM